ncbi:hypothetical protein IWQ60_002593 [Tieghemiomyces parasiticus]|uniref:SET domain-containing protein n=1 Tax=Tieghemiomyces parasiticus TaxID=78921 RepID=A0A9W8AIT3_9FUNG|nr:hypothetical protein IWQ60_002593 [Tieghemiomyces parasiticus]
MTMPVTVTSLVPKGKVNVYLPPAYAQSPEIASLLESPPAAHYDDGRAHTGRAGGGGKRDRDVHGGGVDGDRPASKRRYTNGYGDGMADASTGSTFSSKSNQRLVYAARNASYAKPRNQLNFGGTDGSPPKRQAMAVEGSQRLVSSTPDSYHGSGTPTDPGMTPGKRQPKTTTFTGRNGKKQLKPRWHTQMYIMFLALRQLPGHEGSRSEIIRAAVELDKKISEERGLPRVFTGKTPMNSASACLTNNGDKYFIPSKPPGARSMHFRLSYVPCDFDEAVREYHRWNETLYTKDWPICFGSARLPASEGESVGVGAAPALDATVQPAAGPAPSEPAKGTQVEAPGLSEPAVATDGPSAALTTPPAAVTEVASDLTAEMTAPVPAETAGPAAEPGSPTTHDEPPAPTAPSEALKAAPPAPTESTAAAEREMATTTAEPAGASLPTAVKEETLAATEPSTSEPPAATDPPAPQPVTPSNGTMAATNSNPNHPATDDDDLPRSWQDIVEVRESSIPGAGNGLFAARDLPAYTPLGFYFGVPMTEDEFDSLKDHVGLASHYSIMYRRTVLDATDPEGQPFTDPDGPLYCPFHFMNEKLGHGNVAFLEGHVVNQVICMTTKKVRKGTELFVYYGSEVDREHWSSMMPKKSS